METMLSTEMIIVLILCISAFLGAQCMRFELESGGTKCISEDIKMHAMTVGKYSVVNPNEGYPLSDSYKITVRVSSPHGNTYHNADHMASGNFAFTAAESGDYISCFWVPDHKPVFTVTIEFEWKTGVATKDWSQVAKKGQLEVMEIELKKMFDTVSAIHDEMFYLREREEEMRALNSSTNSRMLKLTFLSLVVCLGVAGLQLWHLKNFFERKKLL